MIVTVCSTEEETAALLATVLDGDHTAASLLAKAIHQDPATVEANTDGLTVSLSPSELGIWIDPIGEELTSYHNPIQHSCRSSVCLYCVFFFFFFKYSRCYQPVHTGPREGAGGRPLVSIGSALCVGSHRRLPAEHRRAHHGRHQSAVSPQRSSRRGVSNRDGY